MKHYVKDVDNDAEILWDDVALAEYVLKNSRGEPSLTLWRPGDFQPCVIENGRVAVLLFNHMASGKES